jgi:uncharacterized protein (UPF0333 family)
MHSHFNRPVFHKIKAQATLEFTLCLLVLVLLFIAGFLVFLWIGKTLAGRQINYDTTKGARNPVVEFYATPPLNLSINIAE